MGVFCSVRVDKSFKARRRVRVFACVCDAHVAAAGDVAEKSMKGGLMPCARVVVERGQSGDEVRDFYLTVFAT